MLLDLVKINSIRQSDSWICTATFSAERSQYVFDIEIVQPVITKFKISDMKLIQTNHISYN